MTAEQQLPEEPPARRRRRWPRVLLAVGALLVLAFAVLWTMRKPLADNYIASELTKYGVKARYRVTGIGFSTQRIEDVVIGDPADPDLRADWVEVKTWVGLTGASVTGVRAGKVWMRARLKDGAISLGQIDKLLPAPSGKPIALPKLHAEIGDAQIRFETPNGLAMLHVTGKGRLDDGFAGRIGARSERMVLGACTAERIDAALAVKIRDLKPRLTGPAQIGALACGTTRADAVSAGLDVTLGEAFDRWHGSGRIGVARVTLPDGRIDRIAGPVNFSGDAKQTRGSTDLATQGFALAGLSGARLALSGRFTVGDFTGFDGTAAVAGLALPPTMLAQARRIGASGAGTPAGPLAAQLGEAIARAGQALDARAAVTARLRGGNGDLLLRQASFAAPGGAKGRFDGQGLVWRWPSGDAQVNGTLAFAGGGLPEARLVLAQAAPGAAVTGTATIAPYKANGAALELAPVHFTAAPDGATRFTTRAVLTGPLGDGGRVERLSLPLDGRWDGGSRLTLNPACGVLGFDRLAAGSMVLDRSRFGVCPIGGGWVVAGPKGLGGGARSHNVHVGGRLGEGVLQLDAAMLELRLATWAFALDRAAVRMGPADAQTRLEIARLDGKAGARGLAGTFSSASGQIRHVPLLLSDAAGNWRYADSVLRVENGLTVADAVSPARFEPLRSEDVVFTLDGNRIAATGTLHTPAEGIKVAGVRIEHDLTSGGGRADLDVPGVTFDPEGFQPTQLTALTRGVIALVKGSVSGSGTIRWSPSGEVTSTGGFRTDGLDLAAAFGPVTGLGTEITFSDLLGLTTPAGQVATIATLNPGLPVENGIVHYRLLGEQKVAIEGGRWPFAGGQLVLEPTVLDFASTGEKKLVFRVKGADAAQFLQQMEFENLNASGIFDGVLPIVFDQRGGRIEGGSLVARAGGGTIAYIGAVSQEDLGYWGNAAFDALKSLRYRELELKMNGALDGEMVTEIRFAGVEQGAGTKTNFLVKPLLDLPLVFNVTIRAPFRKLLGSVQSYYDANRAIELNLPALIEYQSRETGEPIQPPESEPVP